MRILFVERGWEPGGGVFSMRLLVRGLRASHEVSLGVYGDPPYLPRFHEWGIPTLRLGGRQLELGGALRNSTPLRRRSPYFAWISVPRLLIDSLPAALRFARLLRRRRIELVHLNGPPPLYQAEVIGARLVGLPIVCHVRGRSFRGSKRRMADLFLPWVDQFIAISQAVHTAMLFIDVPPQRIRVIYNPVLVPARLSDQERQARRQQAGLEEGACWAVTAGRLLWWKGLTAAIQAVGLLRARGVDLRLLVLGEGPEEPSLREETRRLGLEPFVRFEGWQTTPSDYFAIADILLHPSQPHEAFGRTIIEGMACGLPVVGTNVGGIPEAFTHEVSGLLAEVPGPELLAEPLGRLARDPELRRRMGEAGRLEVERRFSLEAHVAAVEHVYALALAERGPARG